MAAKKKDENLIKLDKDQLEKLIEYYHSENELWNISSSEYFKKEIRQRCLQRICDNMNSDYEDLHCTVAQIQAKLTYLRGYYTRELSKVTKSRKSGAGTEDIYKSPWIHFKSLDVFMRAQIVPRGSHSNLESGSSSQLEQDDMGSEDTTSQCSQASDEDYAPLKKKGKGIKSGPELVTSEAVSLLQDMRKDKNEKKVAAPNDEDELYGQYVASELRKVHDERLKTIIKYRIHTIIFDAQMGNLQGSTHGNSGFMGLLMQQQNAPTMPTHEAFMQPIHSNIIPPQHMSIPPQQRLATPHEATVQPPASSPGPSVQVPAQQRQQTPLERVRSIQPQESNTPKFML